MRAQCVSSSIGNKRTSEAHLAGVGVMGSIKPGAPAIHNGVLVPGLMYGSKSWVWQKKNGNRTKAVDMGSLRSICAVSLRIWEQRTQKRVGKERLRISYASQTGGILKRTQILNTRNQRVCMKRLMDVNELRDLCKDRTMWKTVVSA
ncbi:hypothetical protein EVAR_51084_1 [Eumeta japonica]|uniref:Uncharacterized protein n=1 Tax=Eumeta variegata TaxID=151549 RepID=A0A4C1XNE1_EUMVA|nr:hypothetical protein EVAR_51084_1 [Eumeta japonica]